MEFKPPGSLKFGDNMQVEWKRWLQKFDIYMVARDKKEELESVKIAIFLNLIGDEGLELYNTFPEDSKKTLDNVKKEFDSQFISKVNPIMETFKFNKIVQKEGQNVDMFITDLKKQAAYCDFKCNKCQEPYETRMIRDKVVLGILNKSVQERLLRETELTLEKIKTFCKAVENSQQHIKMLTGSEEEVYASKIKRNCNKCGYEHAYGKCPAFGKICAKCQRRNHFAKMCLNKSEDQRDKRVNILGADDENVLPALNSLEALQITELKMQVEVSIGEVEVEKSWMETILVHQTYVRFKLDSGAEVSILPGKLYKKVAQHIKKVNSQVTIVSYGNYKITPIGEITLACTHGQLTVNIRFLIVDIDAQPILGLRDCIALNLIARIDVINKSPCKIDKSLIIKQYKNVFEGLGKLPGLYKIELVCDAKPVIQAQRKIPFALHDKLKETLQDLEYKNIISKVNYPTDWVQSLIIVEKPNGNLRLCLDPKPLNKFIKREFHNIPTCDDILYRLTGKCIFSVIDMKDGFWQIEIDEESSKLCTFNTPFGRYKFNRLPFGLSSAPELFQRKNYELFGDIPNVNIYFDDIIISGINEQEHDRALQMVLERASQCNVKFNVNKFQYKLSEVTFLGQNISREGITPDKRNIDAILAIKAPENKLGVLRILGMTKFFSKYIQNLSQLTYNMRNLTKNNVKFEWSNIHETELLNIKKILTEKPILQIFDKTKDIVIQTDASSQGIGSCLLQNNLPVAYASRSLSNAELKYAQIEKELAAIVFACEKFHNYIYGYKIKVQTDHKPLIPIIKKDLDKVSARLQRMLLRLLKYNVQLQYIPGKDMLIADTLSRSFIDTPVEDDEEMNYVVHSISKNLPITTEKRLIFQNATQKDRILAKVTQYVNTEWPTYERLPCELKHYYKLRDSLIISDKLLFVNNKVVVPPSLKSEMLKLIHEGHLGIEKSRSRARQVLYWPNMSKDIETFINRCEQCQEHRVSNQKEPFITRDVSSRPWKIVASDILEHNNKYFLIVVDFYSNWIEAIKIYNKSADELIKVLKNIFAKYGIPEIFYSDNNPYNSYKFKQFASDWNFELRFCSPHFHQSNGLAERSVGIVKQMMKKMQCQDDLNLFLMNYRNTPLQKLGYSPAQLFLNRMIRTKLPCVEENLQNKIIDQDLVQNKLKQKQIIQAKYYDRQSKELPELKVGDNIMIQFEHKWRKGRVTEVLPNRTYLVEDMFGRIYRRNRKFLNKTVLDFDTNISRFNYDDYDFNVDLSKPSLEVKDVPSIQPVTRTVRPARTRSRPGYLHDYVTT